MPGMDAPSSVEYLTQPASDEGAKAVLAEPVRRWFNERYSTTTSAQRLTWPALTQKRHLLVSAPTGSGKTLAAFLPIVSQLVNLPPGPGVRCLYLAPLRALCNDLHANLCQHLVEIDEICPSARKPLRVGLRTGDTSGHQRRQLFRDPPEFLLTTPESLALLLSHPQAEDLLGGVDWIIVDEVHSLAGNKRGADLAISLERLSALTETEPQRIGLSATCVPLEAVGRWLVGMGRRVALARVPETARLDLRIEYLGEEEQRSGLASALLKRVLPLLHQGGTTLLFTNVRGLAERLTWSLRRNLPGWAEQIAVHHSSLAPDIRQDVEHRLKAGKLQVVVSSASLELGIDIGSVDQVILIHPPGDTARLLQRLGRSGHRPGRPRRGVLFTSSLPELLEAVAVAGAGQVAQLEPLTIPSHSLDVLCQQLVGMAVHRPWTPAQAWELVRRAYPFRNLPLGDFADCVRYLAGGRPECELPARLRWLDGQFALVDNRTARIYRLNAGTIPAEEAREVRLENGPLLGQISHTFADRLQPGDRFLLEGRPVELTSANWTTLQVKETVGLPLFTRWEGGTWSLPQALAERLWLLRVRAKEALLEGTDALHDFLSNEVAISASAVMELATYLEAQECQSEIPSTGLLVESSPGADGEGWVYAFHLPLAPPACEAMARVLVWRLGQTTTWPQVLIGSLGFGLVLPEETDLDPTLLRELLSPLDFVADLDRALADGPAVGRCFQRVAETGLMLLRNPLGPRRRVGGRDWAGRRLFNWLRFTDPEFPLLRQALREVREEVFASDVALAWLHRLTQQPIRVRRLPGMSPFAASWLPAETAIGAETIEAVLTRIQTDDPRANSHWPRPVFTATVLR